MTGRGAELRHHLPARVLAATTVAAAAGVMLVQTLSYPGTTKLYPSAVLVGLLVLALGVGLQNLPSRYDQTDAPTEDGHHYMVRPALFVVVWLSYPLVMMLLGFVVASTAATSLSLWLLRIKRLPIWVAGTIPTVVALLLVMQVLFNVALPQAPLDMMITNLFYSLRTGG